VYYSMVDGFIGALCAAVRGLIDLIVASRCRVARAGIQATAPLGTKTQGRSCNWPRTVASDCLPHRLSQCGKDGLLEPRMLSHPDEAPPTGMRQRKELRSIR